jgi:hypothetical protein
MKICPKGSDLQSVPVTRYGSSCLYSSCGPVNSSSKYFHYSEVLYCLYTIGKCLLPTDSQVIPTVQLQITCYILFSQKMTNLNLPEYENKWPQNQGLRLKYPSKIKLNASFQQYSCFQNFSLSISETSSLGGWYGNLVVIFGFSNVRAIRITLNLNGAFFSFFFSFLFFSSSSGPLLSLAACS